MIGLVQRMKYTILAEEIEKNIFRMERGIKRIKETLEVPVPEVPEKCKTD